MPQHKENQEMAKPTQQIKLQATQDAKGAWSVGVVGGLSARKNDEGLVLEFINVTAGPGAPDILVSFINAVSHNAFNKPNPKKIREKEPYRLKPGKGGEDFDLRRHLGVAEKTSSPGERLYPIKFRFRPDVAPSAKGSDPGDTDILIEC
jgi:hypothetical protein